MVAVETLAVVAGQNELLPYGLTGNWIQLPRSYLVPGGGRTGCTHHSQVEPHVPELGRAKEPITGQIESLGRPHTACGPYLAYASLRHWQHQWNFLLPSYGPLYFL